MADLTGKDKTATTVARAMPAKKGASKKANVPAKRAAAKRSATKTRTAKAAAADADVIAKPSGSVEHQRAVAKAEHAHQDPRATTRGIHESGSKVQPQNHGEAKARRTPRLNRLGNFFRRGAFWRGKNPPGHG